MRKTKHIRITEIPPELCTAVEAAKILGLSHRGSVNHRAKRFKNLRYTVVCHHGVALTLYNRKDIEALHYKPIPEGYITTKEAGKLLGYPDGTVAPTILLYLKNHNVPHKRVISHHAFLIWEEKAVKKLIPLKRKKCK